MKRLFAVLLATLLPHSLSLAQGVTVPSVNIGVGGGAKGDEVSTSLQILALLTILSIAPSLLILTTAFTRIVIVFSFLRTAMGTQSIPPNPVMIGLSLFLTFYVMGPTFEKINDTALKPYMAKEISIEVATKNAEAPIREFMLKNTYKKDLEMFLSYRNETAVDKETVPLLSLIPAFVISELKTAFVIGFYLFLPFIVIDLIVASILMSMGMMMMPPVVISLPAKILVFVLADGWSVVVKAILSGYM